MSSATSRQIQLASRPTGWPTPENFRTVEIAFPELAPGQVRVANQFISVDPYMRGRMNDVESYIPPFQLGETLTGGAVGRVIESAAPNLPVGSAVLHQYGWRDLVQEDATAFRPVQEIPGVPLSAYLGVLGMTGMTAYVGLTRIAPVHPGDTVFISGAAGAVGSVAGQIARLLGAETVIGSAGSQQKVDLLTERYGFTSAFNYKSAPVREQLASAAPHGINVYFDNVGGDHLEAALDTLNRHGRVAMCGAISAYNTETTAPGPDNMVNIIKQGLSLRGFTLGDHMDLAPEFNNRMTTWFTNGQITHDETVVDGLDNTVDAFLDMMRGGNTGKMVVRTA
ncbi:NADP-dependent oxidoreductase [Kocuria sp.]|uniref:NADP-dependent oxidoreductase n=1 Tax=Kocuria sp. TaxID=1871328 RepID=UPI0026E0446D|nr:NADP-dependent oxidoreductase [Kocuria sp.]MDO5617983.1 NADP-dependent oxidoreductase [Kocuria sp.]